MRLTRYHAKFFVHELSRVGGPGVDRLGRALFDACVELSWRTLRRDVLDYVIHPPRSSGHPHRFIRVKAKLLFLEGVLFFCSEMYQDTQTEAFYCQHCLSPA
jgi:hypothetical protein